MGFELFLIDSSSDELTPKLSEKHMKKLQMTSPKLLPKTRNCKSTNQTVNGQDGRAGRDGQDGRAGRDGLDGRAGQDGRTEDLAP